MTTSCAECVISALCVEKGGPNRLGICHCSICKRWSIITVAKGDGGTGASAMLRPLPDLSCHAKYIVYTNKSEAHTIDCPHCHEVGGVGVLTFVS